MTLSFFDNANRINLENKATSKIKTKAVPNEMGVNTINSMRDSKFTKKQ